jgi:RimJ/RimL family protein N-acetyltransferase
MRRPEEPTEPDGTDPFGVAGDEFSRRTRLRDGTNVLLRPIRPDDRPRLEAGLQRLSPASRYLRFHATVNELSDEQLRYLTEVDQHDHVALVALDLDRPDEPGVGVARFIREPYEPEIAEAAITVADRYQGQGAGTILLGALAHRAREEGVAVFRNYVLDGNHAMLEVFDHLGAHRERESADLWRVDLEVPTDDESVPDSGAGRAFLALARDQRRLTSIIPPIWGRLKARFAAGDLDPLVDDDAPHEALDGAMPPGGDPVPSQEEQEALGEVLDEWLARRDER